MHISGSPETEIDFPGLDSFRPAVIGFTMVKDGIADCLTVVQNVELTRRRLYYVKIREY